MQGAPEDYDIRAMLEDPSMAGYTVGDLIFTEDVSFTEVMDMIEQMQQMPMQQMPMQQMPMQQMQMQQMPMQQPQYGEMPVQQMSVMGNEAQMQQMPVPGDNVQYGYTTNESKNPYDV